MSVHGDIRMSAPGSLRPAALRRLQSTRARLPPRAVAREDDIARAVALEHQIVPRAQRVLDRGGVGKLGREAVFKAQHIVARRMRELGRQYARIAEVAARVAAAVAV